MSTEGHRIGAALPHHGGCAACFDDPNLVSLRGYQRCAWPFDAGLGELADSSTAPTRPRRSGLLQEQISAHIRLLRRSRAGPSLPWPPAPRTPMASCVSTSRTRPDHAARSCSHACAGSSTAYPRTSRRASGRSVSISEGLDDLPAAHTRGSAPSTRAGNVHSLAQFGERVKVRRMPGREPPDTGLPLHQRELGTVASAFYRAPTPRMVSP